MRYGGALPMQHIKELLSGGFVQGAVAENIRTGSLDLTLTDEVYRVNGAFLPGCDETVEMALKRAGGMRIPDGSLLERGCCYICRLAESIQGLPEEMYAYANPKSSSGRIDLHVRLMADRVSRYDSIPRGYRGTLWALLAPKKFPVVIRPGVTLNQLRFFNQDTRLDLLRLQIAFEQDGGFLYHRNGDMIRYRSLEHSDRDGSIILTLGLGFEIPGFEAIDTGEPIDLSKVGYYDPRSFFRPVTIANGSIVLTANTFYILSSKEYVRVPPSFACEMSPMDEKSGELRSHYAGFIDSGWGIGPDGSGTGRPLTLEVRSFDNGIIIRDGQPVAKVWYERVVEIPEQHYEQMSPTYSGQFGPALSKHFQEWKY